MSKNKLVECEVHYRKIVKMKGDKFLETDENKIKRQIFRDGGSINLDKLVEKSAVHPFIVKGFTFMLFGKSELYDIHILIPSLINWHRLIWHRF